MREIAERARAADLAGRSRSTSPPARATRSVVATLERAAAGAGHPLPPHAQRRRARHPEHGEDRQGGDGLRAQQGRSQPHAGGVHVASRTRSPAIRVLARRAARARLLTERLTGSNAKPRRCLASSGLLVERALDSTLGARLREIAGRESLTESELRELTRQADRVGPDVTSADPRERAPPPSADRRLVERVRGACGRVASRRRHCGRSSRRRIGSSMSWSRPHARCGPPGCSARPAPARRL